MGSTTDLLAREDFPVTYANDGRFGDGSAVLVWYPLPGADEGVRSGWAWLPGSVLAQVGPEEWHVIVDGVAEVARDGAYPCCFRDASELRPVSLGEWRRLATSEWALAAEAAS